MLIKPVSIPTQSLFLKEPVSLVRRSEVYVLTAARNAWHRTKINRYTPNDAMFTTSVSARSAAFPRRQRGTYFLIYEVPALVFDLPNFSLVIVHLNATPPFRKWKLPSVIGNSHRTLVGGDVVKLFEGDNFGSSSSGWSANFGEQTVLMGMVDTDALPTSRTQRRLRLECSFVDSGLMHFKEVSKTPMSRLYLDRIVTDLDNSTYQRRRVHEVARRHNTKSSKILELLVKIGSPAKGPRSWVGADDVDRIRRLL